MSLALGAAVFLVLAGTGRPARAQGAEKAYGKAMEDMAPLAVAFMLLPSSLGPELAFPKAEPTDLRFIIGWPFQIPLPFGKKPTFDHRIALAPEVALGARNKAVFRGRLGYRFGHAWFFGGVGFLADKSAVFVSPELGVRYPSEESDFMPGGALTFRCDVEPRDAIVRMSAQLGWVLL